MRGKHILFITLIFFITMNNVWGRTLKNRFSGMGYVTIGQHSLNTSEFDTILQSSNLLYPEPVKSLFEFGGGGLFLINKWVISGEGAGVSSAQEFINGYQTKLNGGFVRLEFGRLLYENSYLHIFPLLGIGNCVYSYKINKDINETTFGDIINEPLTGTALSTSNLFVNAAIGADYNINLSGSDIDAANLVFGIRIGYNYSLGAKDWKVNGLSTNLTNGPDIGLEGLYINLIFGVSGSNFQDEKMD